MNEIAETQIIVEKVNPEIKIVNKEKLDALVDAVVKKYSGMVVTEETLSESKKTLAELRKLNKELNAKRLEVQREYEKPAKEFKGEIDAYIAKLSGVIDEIKQGTDDFEEKRKSEKRAEIQNLIAEMSVNYGIEPERIEIDKKWLNKSMTMPKVTEAIANKMKETKRLDDDWEVVKKYAKSRGVLAEDFESFVGVYSTLEIEKMIDDKADEMEKQAKEVAREKQLASAINEETGEITQPIQQVTFIIQGTEEQLNDVARFLKNSGVEIVSASERQTVIGG